MIINDWTARSHFHDIMTHKFQQIKNTKWLFMILLREEEDEEETRDTKEDNLTS